MEKLYRKANIMYVPALILFIVFVVYPFLDGIRIAFTNWNGFSQHYKYVGFANFARLAADLNVVTAFRNTLVYGFGSTMLQQLLGLAFALLLNASFPGKTAARTIIYLPVMISAVIMGYMWVYLCQYDGALNDLMVVLGLGRILWLSDQRLAIPLIVIINSLQYVGISMVIYLAGLQGIPNMYYEAVSIEGAGAWISFRNVTLPLLYPAFMTSVTVNLIGGLKLFDVIRALTGGGPGYTTHSLATLIHASYFAGQSAGYAAAIGLLLFGMILIVTVILQAAFRGKEVEYL
jgi:ABC-type sugar transport systems, permease components